MQGTSICSRGPRVRRVSYESGQIFWDFLIVVKKILVKNILDSFLQHEFFTIVPRVYVTAAVSTSY